MLIKWWNTCALNVFQQLRSTARSAHRAWRGLGDLCHVFCTFNPSSTDASSPSLNIPRSPYTLKKKKNKHKFLILTTSWVHHRAPSPHFSQHPHTHSLMSPSLFGFFAGGSLKAAALPGSHTPRLGPTSPIFSLFSSDQPPRSKNSFAIFFLCLLCVPI